LLPVPDVTRQYEVVAEADRVGARHQQLLGAIDRQIALLHERRQALITAAVAGELQVPDRTMANAAA